MFVMVVIVHLLLQDVLCYYNVVFDIQITTFYTALKRVLQTWYCSIKVYSSMKCSYKPVNKHQLKSHLCCLFIVSYIYMLLYT